MLGAIQPDVIRRLSSESYDDGFLQRMLLVVMRAGEVGRDVPTPDVSGQYARLIERLVQLTPPCSAKWNDITGDDDVLRFDGEAQALRDTLEAEHHQLMHFEVFNRKLAAHIGKYDGLFGRLCVAFHCIEHAHDKALPAVVSEDTATRVARFMREFLLPHARAFYAGVLQLADDHERLAAIAGYILAHRKERMTNRDVQRGDGTMRKLTQRDTDSAFEQLEALGWVTPVMEGGYRPRRWTVNPAVHVRFGERAQKERERRIAAQNAINAGMRR